MNILVVEDGVEVAEAIMESIERWGYCADWSETGEDSLQKVRQQKYDLILLDIFLSDVKGYVLIPQFKEVWPEIGIVTMTGYNSRELEKEKLLKRLAHLEELAAKQNISNALEEMKLEHNL